MSTKYFLWLDGIQGDSTAPHHPGEMDLTSVVLNESHSSVHGGGTNRAQVGDIVVTKPRDRTSAALWLACATGRPFQEGVVAIEEYSEKGKKLYSVFLEMSEVFIASLIHRGTDIETITLNFSSVHWARL